MQVLLVYLGASWGVLQVADQVVTRFELPEWVYAAAFLLLLIGLPIVLATAFVQEGGPVSSASGAALAADPAVTGDASLQAGSPTRRGMLTWRNAILGGLAAAALWG